MKHYSLKALTWIAAASLLFSLSSCEKVDQQDETVSVYLTYTITSDNGEAMPGTKATNADVFNEFYQKIKSGELVAPNYNLVFTEKTTGAVYTVNGTWAGKDMVTLRTGTYSVVGTSTASGENIQEKCSLIFDDEITVDINSTTINLKASYDCALIIFSDASIAKLSNFNGNSSTDLFKFNNYIYAFIHTTLYAEGKQAQAYLEGRHTNDTQFKIYTGNLNYEIGKYYVYNDINAAFDLDKMEEGGSEGQGSIVNLSSEGTANSYIVSSAGTFKFNASVKGNSTESVGAPVKAEVLWESFGTDVQPSVGEIIASISFLEGYVIFSTPASLVDGNALVAVKDASNNILWSWHIWICKDYDVQSSLQVYKNNAGVMMDRNLGALSATPGDVKALGLMYQWGRKDPFMGGCKISYSSSSGQSQAKSSVSWPQSVQSNSSRGTYNYANSNPMTYITQNTSNYDWLYSSSDVRWSPSEKTKNDPCPVGYRVPAGGSNGIWEKAGYSSTWNSSTRTISLSILQNGGVAYYPACGFLTREEGLLNYAGENGLVWSATQNGNMAYYMDYVLNSSNVSTYNAYRADARPVRCQKM